MRTKPERGVPPSPLHIHSHARPTRVDPHNRCLRYMYVWATLQVKIPYAYLTAQYIVTLLVRVGQRKASCLHSNSPHRSTPA